MDPQPVIIDLFHPFLRRLFLFGDEELEVVLDHACRIAETVLGSKAAVCPDLQDQRISRVYLTKAGKTIQEEVQEVWHTLETETFDGFDMQERVLLRRFLLQMRENLVRVTEKKLGH